MLKSFDLTGKTAIVTGARKGLGFGAAPAEPGADICAVGPLPVPELEKNVTAKTTGRACVRWFHRHGG